MMSEKKGQKIGRDLRGVVSYFIQTTSIQPLSELKFAPFKILKLAWFIVFIVASYFLAIHVYELVHLYRQYPVSLKYKALPQNVLPFPAVTVCNLNSLKKTNVKCTDYEAIVELDLKKGKTWKCENQINAGIVNSGALYSDMFGSTSIYQDYEYDDSASGSGTTKEGDWSGSGEEESGTGLSKEEPVTKSEGGLGSVSKPEEPVTGIMDGWSGSENMLEEKRKQDGLSNLTMNGFKQNGNQTDNSTQLDGVTVDGKNPPNEFMESLKGPSFTKDSLPKEPSFTQDPLSPFPSDPEMMDPKKLPSIEGSGFRRKRDVKYTIETKHQNDRQKRFVPKPPTPPPDMSGYGSMSGFSGMSGYGSGNLNPVPNYSSGSSMGGSIYGSGSGMGSSFNMPKKVGGGAADTYQFVSDIKSNVKNSYKNHTSVFALLVSRSKTGDLTDVNNLIRFPNDAFIKYGNTKEEFIIQCSIDNSVCTKDDFTHFLSPTYGNCFTFNTALSSNKSQGMWLTRKHGSEYGLRLQLNIDHEEYIGYLSSELGARIAIHSPFVKPHPQSNGFISQPGYKTSVGLRLKTMRRLKAPFESKCASELVGIDERYYTHPQNAFYTREDCLEACMVSRLAQCCNCSLQYGQFYEDYIATVNSSQAVRFSIFNKTHLDCMTGIEAKNVREGAACNCPPPCIEQDFDKTIYQSAWPSKPRTDLFLNHPGQGPDFSKWTRIQEQIMGSTIREKNEFVQDNVAAVHVYYEALTDHLYQEEPSLTFNQIFADVGGTMGVYMGLSIMTILEVLQFFVVSLVTCCGVKRNLRTPVSDIATEQ